MTDNFFDDGTDSEMEFKVVLIGDSCVGKTSIINKFYSNHFNTNESPTIAASYLPVPMIHKGLKICLNIWDTAGTEKFQSLVPLYTRQADALLVVFDLSNPESFNGAKRWYSNTIKEVGPIPNVVLIGNKLDLCPKVNCTDYETYAKESRCTFFKTSALEGTNIKDLFEYVADALTTLQIQRNLGNASITLNKNDENKEPSKCGC